MNSIFKLVPFENKYISQVIDMLNICFPGKSISKKTFIWKHFDSFFNKKSVGYLAFDGNKLSSCVFFTPITITNGNNESTYYNCAVQATHPAYRRLGLVTKLTKQIERKLHSNNYLGFSNMSGVNIDKYSQKIAYRILGRLRKYYIFAIPRKSSISIELTDTIMNPVFINNNNMFHISYSKQYLNWRYINNPKEKFIFLECKTMDKVIGNIIAKKSRFGISVSLVNLSDLTYLNDCMNALSQWSFVHKFFFIKFLFLPNKTINNLKHIFFCSTNSDIYFTVKSSIRGVQQADNWLVQAGDVQ